MDKIDIILVTCNRLNFLKKCIESMESRLTTPFRLIIINNNSIDGTDEYLKELKEKSEYEIVIVRNEENKMPLLSGCYTQGLKYVESEFFFCTQDDIIIPYHKPDVAQKLIHLLIDNPRYAAITLRKPFMKAPDKAGFIGNVTRLKTAGAGFRVHRLSEWKDVGFGNRRWETLATRKYAVGMGKIVGCATNLWLYDLGWSANRGYSKEYIDSVSDTGGYDWIKRKPYGFTEDRQLPEVCEWTHAPFFLGNNVLRVQENKLRCGSIFRIQRTAEVKEIGGFGISQYERPWWAAKIYDVLKKKTGIVPKNSGVTASEWKNDGNKGYGEDFKDYNTLNQRQNNKDEYKRVCKKLKES